MAKVEWKKISLKGFGPFRTRMTVELQTGFNVLVAPNETGKSTLLSGLLAILFGLPNVNDPSKFGISRFRSWDGSEPFEGEVIFAVDDKIYRIKRQFATHWVEVARKEKGLWQEEISLEHNPIAQKGSGRYQKYLQKLIGVANGDIFAASFYLEQPLPEGEQLSEHVQSLLSGSGGHFKQALNELADGLAILTKEVSRYGFPRDKNKNRKLENLRHEIEELEEGIEAGRTTVEELQTTLVSLGELDHDLKQIKQTLQTKKQLKDAWGKGRQLHQRYQETLEKQLEFQDARNRLNTLEEAITQEKQELNKTFAVFHNGPAELNEELDQLLGWEETLQNLKANLEKIKIELIDKKAEFKILAGELAELKSFQKNPRLLADYQTYIIQYQQKEALLAKLADLALLPPWGTFAEAPSGEVKNLQKEAANTVRNWEQLQEYHQEIGNIEKEIKGQYFCFQGLSTAQKEALGEYTFRKLRLETELKEYESLWVARQKELTEYQREKERFQQEFGDLEGLEEGQVKKKIELLQEQKELQREGINTKGSKAVILAGRLTLVISMMVALSIAGWAIKGMPGGMIGLFLGSLLGWGLGYLVLGKKGHSSPRSKEIETELVAINEALGSHYGSFSEIDLGILREKMRHFSSEAERLKEREKQIQQFELEGLKTSRDDALEQWEAFQALLKEQISFFGEELPKAYMKFQELKHRQQGLEDKVKEAVKEEWPDSWQGLISLGELKGIRCFDLEELVNWLRSLDENWWQEILSSAIRWEKINGELEIIAKKENNLASLNEDGLTQLEEYEQKLVNLAENIYPYDINSSMEVVEEDAFRYQELREQLSGVQETINQLARQTEELEDKRAGLNKQIEQQRSIYRVYLELGEGDFLKTKILFRSYQERQQALNKQERQLMGLLEGIQVKDKKELDVKLLDAKNEAQMILKGLEELGAKYPSLPSFSQIKERQALEEEYFLLEKEITGLEEKEESLRELERELGRQQSRLEGRELLNLAQGEIELQELKEQEIALQFEAQALGIAHQELKGAVQAYNYSYRERLAEQASNYFRQFTGSAREVLITEDFEVQVMDTGRERLASQFSQGTKEQLFLALRLAIGDLLAEEIYLPFIFDDPFLNYDQDRLEEVKELLQNLALERQIFLLSHREDLKDWGSQVNIVKGDA